MYQKVLGCCSNPQDVGGSHTIEVVSVENRFTGGTATIGAPSRDPAIFLTPEVKTQSETVWRTNTVAQPVHVVFTYSNRTNELRSVASSQPPMQQQTFQHYTPPPAVPEQRIFANEQVNHVNSRLPFQPAYEVKTSLADEVVQKSITEHPVVRKAW